MGTATATQDHASRLLLQGRCGRCAEVVGRPEILTGGDCGHCGAALDWGDASRGALQTRNLQWRLAGYALVGLASFLAGIVPLLQVAVQLAALVILHVVVLRRGLLWLPAARRILARMSMKLLGAAIAVVALLVNVAIAPLVGVSAFVLAAVGPLLTAAYVEGGLRILRKRMRWQEEGRKLTVAEWGLPTALLAVLVGTVTVTAGVVAAVLHAASQVEVPSITQLTELLMGWMQ